MYFTSSSFVGMVAPEKNGGRGNGHPVLAKSQGEAERRRLRDYGLAIADRLVPACVAIGLRDGLTPLGVDVPIGDSHPLLRERASCACSRNGGVSKCSSHPLAEHPQSER